ncbi:hypothetical protein SAY87_028458 [Trapa incisa]|uniref:Protein kinase domain-containing protein n=1 Tax=Trapa incisa TaxID=236973 RepID=A0AAN7KVP9_9MYRT|nr:hypothetical protein SAY87_028458 [Trapa incisa]
MLLLFMGVGPLTQAQNDPVLELRTLDSSTYNTTTTSAALKTIWRNNIGSSTNYRYPQDPYDRIWQGRIYDSSTTITNTTNIDRLKSNNNAYKVPLEVFMTAESSFNSSYPFKIYWTSSNSSYNWYVFLHFAEIQVLLPGQVRNLPVYVNNNIFVTTVIAEYLKPVTVSSPPFSGTVLNFSIHSQSGSNLSAFLNAAEIFQVVELVNSPTDLDNVNAMLDIASTYGVYGDVWQGDPCHDQQTSAQLLMIVHHKNLVSLIGYCDDPENLSLVYEYMINGNLRQHLSGTILIHLKCLEYLHNGCRPPIVHRDLKTSNILLNDKMQAKIADFGLSRVFVTDQKNFGISTLPAGTPGYFDPMYNISGNLNSASDIYSFGVILFELITGYPAIIRDSKGSTHVVQWVTPFIEKGDVQSITDPRIHGLFDASSAWKALEIATQ